jgi:hypothetical protein
MLRSSNIGTFRRKIARRVATYIELMLREGVVFNSLLFEMILVIG